jgi:hypothetical protein
MFMSMPKTTVNEYYKSQFVEDKIRLPRQAIYVPPVGNTISI